MKINSTQVYNSMTVQTVKLTRTIEFIGSEHGSKDFHRRCGFSVYD